MMRWQSKEFQPAQGPHLNQDHPIVMPEDTRQPLGKKQKIAVLVRNFVITGGAERYAYQVCRRLARTYEVHIFCQTWDEQLVEGFRIHRVPRPLRRPSVVNQLLFSRSCGRLIDDSFALIYSHERVTRYDVLSVHCPCYMSFLTRSRGLRKILLWLRELTSPYGIAYLWLERRQFAARPDRFMIADSRMAADDVLRNYPRLSPEQICVAYPGVDLEEIDQALATTDRAGLRQKYDLTAADFALLFVGTEFKRKGLDALLQGLALVTDSRVKLLVAGAGDIATYRQQAERLGVAERVTFLGRIAEIYPYYILADAFVLPTLADPCPIAPLEAMTCGTPTIMSATPWCGTAEHVTNDEAIILQNPQDSAEIARAIGRMLEPEPRASYARKGRERGRQLGWEHTTAVTLQVFERVLQGKRAGK